MLLSAESSDLTPAKVELSHVAQLVLNGGVSSALCWALLTSGKRE